MTGQDPDLQSPRSLPLHPPCACQPPSPAGLVTPQPPCSTSPSLARPSQAGGPMFSPEPVTSQTGRSAPAETEWTGAPGGAPGGQDCMPSLWPGPRSPSLRPGLCSSSPAARVRDPNSRPRESQVCCSFASQRPGACSRSSSLQFRLANLWWGPGGASGGPKQ